MARNVKAITIDLKGRDHGKVFILNEMNAAPAEKWAMKALIAMAKSGVELPDNIASSGLAGLAQVGIKMLTHIHFDDLDPLLEEMFAMITYLPDPQKPAIKLGFGGVGPLPEDAIEDVTTRLFLRKELLLLHINFFIAADLLT